MKNILPIITDKLPRGSAALLKPCVCGHSRYKHVAFAHECREAGCKCQFFGERQTVGEQRGQPLS